MPNIQFLNTTKNNILKWNKQVFLDNRGEIDNAKTDFKFLVCNVEGVVKVITNSLEIKMSELNLNIDNLG